MKHLKKKKKKVHKTAMYASLGSTFLEKKLDRTLFFVQVCAQREEVGCIS